MSKYTTELRWPIENRLRLLGKEPTEDNWPDLYDMLGLADYPIFEEAHRQVLNNKIIRRFYLREIGFETIGLFRWQLRRTMFEIMPYYNQLYESETFITDPMLSRDMEYREVWSRDERIAVGTRDDSDRNRDASSQGTRDTTGSVDQTVTGSRDTTEDTAVHDDTGVTGSTTGTSDSRNVFQDTPMNGLDTGAIEAMDYATNVTFDHSEEQGTSRSDTDYTRDQHVEGTETTKEATDRDETGTERTTSTESERETVGRTGSRDETGDYDGTKVNTEKGYTESQADLLLKYRKTIVNIDLEIMEQLEPLFLGLW